MGNKSRWSDPANIGQPDYVKVGMRVMIFMILLVIAAMVKIGIKNNWFQIFRDISGY